MTISSRTKRKQTRRGATLVEAAFVLPVVLMFVLGIIEYSRYVMTLQMVNNAAREGCRYAITHLQPVVLGSTTYGNATTDVTNVVTKYLGGQTLVSQSVQVYASDALGNNTGTWTNAQAGQSICVKITGNFKFVVTTLLGLPSTASVTATSVMDCESY